MSAGSPDSSGSPGSGKDRRRSFRRASLKVYVALMALLTCLIFLLCTVKQVKQIQKLKKIAFRFKVQFQEQDLDMD